MTITFDSYSDSNSRGLIHSENQDSLLCDKENLVFAVADGVGGYPGAKEASNLAVELLRERSRSIMDQESLRSVIQEIHLKIKREAAKTDRRGMGTTIAASKIISNMILSANVGDSPIFLFRGEIVRTLYHDDSHRFENPQNMWSLVQYLGYEGSKLTVHVKSVACQPGDTLLICSDGVSDNILGTANKINDLAKLVKETKSARKIVQQAMGIGLKPDDMSAILIQFH